MPLPVNSLTPGVATTCATAGIDSVKYGTRTTRIVALSKKQPAQTASA